MYWVTDSVGELWLAGPLQTPALGGWIVVIALCLLLAGSGALAWRRNRPTETPSPSPELAEPTPTPDPIGLTDEERVVQLLESNGGRMHQTEIVEETGWSKSKVSMLLSEMAAEGTISKLRVGRENIISRPGFEPEVTRSPLETGT